jgi:hypothetical protein
MQARADYGIDKIAYWWVRLRGMGLTDEEIARRVYARAIADSGGGGYRRRLRRGEGREHAVNEPRPDRSND